MGRSVPHNLKSIHQTEFVKIFNSLCGRYGRWEIWQDFITLAAIAISNTVDRSHAAEREKTYMTIAGKYKPEEMLKFSQMLQEVVIGMDFNPDQDFLGELYMALDLGNDHAGQFFTPYDVCRMMAEITGTDLQARIERDGWISVNDCACGAGALLVAFANACTRQEINYQTSVLFTAQDIDYIVGLMCYLQLSLMGCAGYKERQQSQQPDPEAEAREERRRRDEQAENEFAEAAEAHFELRKDFIKELPNSVFKQHMKEISLFCVATTESIDGGYCNSINPRFCAQLLGMRLSPDDENEDFCDMGFVRSAAEAQPEKLIFCCCYSALDDEDMSYYRRVWNMNHYEYEPCENSDLDHIYEILETLGYEKSDDEEEMAEGTHRLFDTYGAQPDKTTEDSDDE